MNARSRWDATGLTDPRVVHLWDAKDVSGAWLAGNVQGYQDSDWDSYLLFGPEATWTSHPTPLRNSGAPVFDQIQELRQALTPRSTTTAAVSGQPTRTPWAAPSTRRAG